MAHGTHAAGNGKPQKNIPAKTNWPYLKKVGTPSDKCNTYSDAGKFPYAKKGTK